LGSEKADDYLQDSGRISLSLIVLVVFLCGVMKACALFSSQPDAVLRSLLLGGAGDHGERQVNAAHVASTAGRRSRRYGFVMDLMLYNRVPQIFPCLAPTLIKLTYL